ncbi:MAG TPA: RidA family protein [Candidatus Binataceae bacterium]|nr:RidA family protein [Candidatus Binataceae bacterium]
MDDIIRISSSTRWEPVFGYSRAVRIGDLVVVSGTTATNESGAVVAVNQMYSQARQTIANIGAALTRAGASLSDVIRTRVFVTDITRFREIARAHSEAFGSSPPASTMVEVRRLIHPDMLIEIEADAIIRSAHEPASSAKSGTPAKNNKTTKPKAKAKTSGATSRSKPSRRK